MLISKTEYRRDIQCLRGLAIFSVILFHAYENFFVLGYLGVDIFFVISGYVVTPLIIRIFTQHPIYGGGVFTNLKYFYIRRFYRLVPALSASLVFFAFVILLVGSPQDHQKFAKQGIATLFLVGNLGAYRYSGNYFSPNPNPLVHTWSLSLEEQIYLFLPIFLIIILYKSLKIVKVVTYAYILISFISFSSFLLPAILQPLYSLAGIQIASQASFYSPIDRIWQFTLGGLAYLLLNKYSDKVLNISRIYHLVLICGLLLLLLTPLQIDLKNSSVLATFLTLAVIMLRSLKYIPDYISTILEKLGNSSYSIYLVHMPILYLAKYSPAFEFSIREDRLIQSTFGVIASIVFGNFSYLKIENRFRNFSGISGGKYKKIANTFLITFLFPLTIFFGIEKGSNNQYWGLDRNLPKPAYPLTLDLNCFSNSKNGDPCTYDNNGENKVLLIGDSHAGHISQAFISAAKNQKWNAIIIIHSSCRVNFERPYSNQDSKNCLSFDKKLISWIFKNKPDSIILSTFVTDKSNQRDVQKLLLKLKTLTPNVLFVGNNPIFPDKEFMQPRPLILPAYDISRAPKSFPESQMVIEPKKLSDDLSTWARKKEIKTLDLWSLFCNGNICSRYSNSSWLYIDTDHFSIAGALLTIPKLENYLNKVN